MEGGTTAGEEAVPVTIVSGFLGAGKSTLVRRVLRERHGQRVLVVENELGEDAGVEGAIVTDGGGAAGDDDASERRAALAEIVELPNGCACCTLRDELVESLSTLVRRRRFDRVLIETSGAADPTPIAALFWTDDALELGVRLDAIVAVVDARHAPRHLGRNAVFDKQVAVADVLLLNKAELVEADDLTRLRGALAALCAPGTPLLACTRCAGGAADDLSALLDVRTLRRVGDGGGDEEGRHERLHDRRVGALTFRFGAEVSFDAGRLQREIGALLWEAPADDGEARMEVWRLKAVVNVAPGEKWIFQAVHEQFDGEAAQDGWRQERGREEPRSVFIFIGRGLVRERIASALHKAATHDGNRRIS